MAYGLQVFNADGTQSFTTDTTTQNLLKPLGLGQSELVTTSTTTAPTVVPVWNIPNCTTTDRIMVWSTNGTLGYTTAFANNGQGGVSVTISPVFTFAAGVQIRFYGVALRGN